MADDVVTVGGPERDPRRRKRRTRLTAVVAVAAAVAAIGRLWLAPQPGHALSGRGGIDKTARTWVYPAAIVARIPVSGVISLVADGPSLWAVRVYGQIGVNNYQLVKIDMRTNVVTLRVNLGSVVSAVAADDGMVWLTTGHGQASGQLIRIDPTTGRVIVTVHLAARACDLITFSGGRSLWAECAMRNSRPEFVRVDPLTGRMTGRVGPVSEFAGPITATPSGILYTDGSSDYWLIQVGRPAARLIKVQAGPPPSTYGGQRPLVFMDGDVWALNDDESVTKADLASGRVLRVYGYRSYDPGHAGGLDYFTVGDGSLWFLDDGYPFNGVLRVSIATGRPLGAVAEPIVGDCGVTPCAQIYATPGAIWVPTTASLIRIDPARMPG